VAWAGFNGMSDEIYYSTWKGTSFATAAAITANDIPDIQPVLGIDEVTGMSWPQWMQFSQKGYVKYESTWNGSAWSQPRLIPTANSTTGEQSTGTPLAVVMKKAITATKGADTSNQASKTTTPANHLEVEIPDFITVPESASIHIPGYTVQSLPVRNVAPLKITDQ
jgi:hypothetical protein